MTVDTDRWMYMPGEAVDVKITVTNLRRYPVTLHFHDSCEAGFVVEDLWGHARYNSRFHTFCLMVLMDLTLLGGQERTYEFTWNQMDDSQRPVPIPTVLKIRGEIYSAERVLSAFTWIAIVAVLPVVLLGFEASTIEWDEP